MRSFLNALGNAIGLGPIDGLTLATPAFLLLLPVIALLLWRQYRTKIRPAVIFPATGRLKGVKPGWRAKFSRFMLPVRLFGLILIIIALCRPQGVIGETEILTEGVDIILALDVSTSMLAEDFRPKNRMQVAHEAVKAFIDTRENDRIGLIVFSGEAYTQCPLTLDYEVLKKLVDQAEPGVIADGTAIGSGLALAVNRLRESTSESKLIILLTDGRNNMGEIEPETAAEMAKALGIKIYTVGTGKHGPAPYPVQDPVFGRRYVTIDDDLDDEMLTKLSSITGGKYYRADDAEKALEIYREISELEKSKVETKMYFTYDELFHIPLMAGLFLLGLEGLLNATILRRLP